jgi:undecaprenyl-diphosphatase
MTDDDTVSTQGVPAGVTRFDDAVDEFWERTFRGNPVADRVFYLASELGDFSLIWLLIAAARGLRSDEDAATVPRIATVLLAESLLVNQGIKRLVRRERPPADQERPHNLRQPSTSSFPSGHASSAFTAAGLLAETDPRLAPVYYGVAVIVSVSRIHVKIHHGSDVVAGALLGAGIAATARRAWPATGRGRRRG